MEKLFPTRVSPPNVRAFFNGVDEIYLVAEKSWFYTNEFYKLWDYLMDCTYSVRFHPYLDVEEQLNRTYDFYEVIV